MLIGSVKRIDLERMVQQFSNQTDVNYFFIKFLYNLLENHKIFL